MIVHISRGYKQHAEKVWDKLAGNFNATKRWKIEVGKNCFFQVLHLPRREEFVPNVYLETPLSFLAWPRLAGYQHRFVLCARDAVLSPNRWKVRCEDVLDWIHWSAGMSHIVTFSTFKSGTSTPFFLHAQSFPFQDPQGTFSALAGADRHVERLCFHAAVH